MEPITFIALMWFSWGLTSMVVRDGDEGDKPTAADWNTARPSGKGGRAKAEATTEPDPEIRERIRKTIREWIKSADGNADAARNIRWTEADWWRQAVFAAAWNPVRDVRDATKWAKRKHDEHKARREAQADESAGEPTGQQPDDPPDPGEDEGITHDDDTTYGAGWFRWGRTRREEPPTAPPAPDPEPDEFTVEFVGSRPNTPPPAALVPPQRALTAADDEDPAPEAPPTLAEPTPTEGTPSMSGQLATAPSAGGLTIPGQSNIAHVGGGDGLTHDEAMAMAAAIVRLIGDCPDPVGRVLKLIETSAQGVAQKIDNFQAAGVTGSVLGRWCDVMVAFATAHNTARLLRDQIDAAHQAAADARRHQAAVGNPVQETITAAGANAATRTDYYAKQ